MYESSWYQSCNFFESLKKIFQSIILRMHHLCRKKNIPSIFNLALLIEGDAKQWKVDLYWQLTMSGQVPGLPIVRSQLRSSDQLKYSIHFLVLMPLCFCPF